MIEGSHGPIDRDQADSLKMEISVLSPSEDEHLKVYAGKVAAQILHDYGKYIPEKTKEKNIDVSDRLVVTDREGFEGMYEHWKDLRDDPNIFVRSLSAEMKPPLSLDTKALKYSEGDLMVFDHPEYVWSILPQEFREEVTEQVGDEEGAKYQMTWFVLGDFVTHEVIHQFQYDKLPAEFLECGVKYYQMKVAGELGLGRMMDDVTEKRILFYQELLNTYGDSVHTLFFTGEMEHEQRVLMFQELWKVADQLFPNKEHRLGE